MVFTNVCSFVFFFKRRFLAVASLKGREAVRKLGSSEDKIPSDLKTDLVKSPQRVGVVPYISDAFENIDIFKNGFKSLAIVWCRGEGLYPEH